MESKYPVIIKLIIASLIVPIMIKLVEWALKYIDPIKVFEWIKLNYFPVKFNLGISIDHGDDKQRYEYHEEIVEQLRVLINKYGLEKVIKLKPISNQKSIKNKEDAEKFRQNKKIDLLVWGRLSSPVAKRKGHSVVKPSLYFTYGHPNDSQNRIGAALKNEIDMVLITKAFVRKEILENDSYDQIRLLNEDIFDVGMYIIGLSMKMFGKLSKSMSIFESMLNRVKNEKNYFAGGVIFHLENVYHILLENYIWTETEFKDALQIANKWLKIRPKNHEALVSKAYHSYKLGYPDKSIDVVSILKNEYPNSSATYLDVAFFNILNKEYKKAYKQYLKLTKVLQPKFIPLQVIDFLNHKFDQNPDEFGFLFASAFINYFFADKKRALQLFKIFVENADKNRYKEMYRKSRAILNKAK